MEDAEVLLKKLAERYDKNPVGWKTLAFQQKGSTLLIIMTPEKEVYEVKIVPLDPLNFIGVGVRVSGIEGLEGYLGRLPNYGFRPVPERLFNAILRSGGVIPSGLVRKLLEVQPIPLGEARCGALAQGPITYINKDLASISPKQRELQQMLSREVERLFYKRYRDRAMIYM